MKKGQPGSPGGKIAHTGKPKPRETNPSPCPTCGAGRGEPCVRVVSGSVKKLHRLHRSPAPAKRPYTRAGHARQAFKDAQELGPIVPLQPTERRVDDSPRLGPGQVYATWTGTLYHPAWCIVVATKWDNDPDGLLVIAESTAGRRKECTDCADPLTD